MDWDLDLVKEKLGVAIGRISNRAVFLIGHSREILELLLGLMNQEFATGETLKYAASIISRVMEMKGKFPRLTFRHQDECTQ